jgi:hypothetical protein
MASSSTQSSVTILLSGSVLAHLWLLSLLEERILSLLLLTLLSCKVLLTSDLLDLLAINSGQIDLLGSGNNVAGVNAAEGNTVDLEWAGYEEDTLREGLQKNDALAAETTSQEDEDGTGLESRAGSGSSDGFADLKCIVSRVPGTSC